MLPSAHAHAMQVEQEVLGKVSPTAERRDAIQRTVRSLLETVRKEADARDLGLEVMLVGSVAKDTYLNDPDIDVFVLFPELISRNKLEKTGLDIGRRTLTKVEERYAEHPYIHGEWEGLEVDLVPCYHIKDPQCLRSAVDRTPFHTRYVQSHLGEGQKGEVRLLKRFAKGVGVYGAEARVQGFSGYLLEILVMKYGSFRAVLEHASEWKKGVTLGLEEDQGKRFQDPLVFYDPVDRGRNVASALSANSFALFIHAAREYLKAPSERFFFPSPREPLSVEDIRKAVAERGTGMVVVELDRPDLIDDNLYPQARKSLDGLAALLASYDFTVLDKTFHIGDRIRFVIELRSLTLPRAARHNGPPAWIDNASSFLEKWKGAGLSEPFLENGHWSVMVRREHTGPKSLIEAKFSSAGLGSDLRDLKGLRVETGEMAISERNRSALSLLLDKRKNWEV